jgi:RNA 2',3'-cyclic 3'-phosphodiesterase
VRLFVAVDVDDEVRAAIEPRVAPLRDDERMSWTRPDGWHLTLAFLGTVPEDRIDEVVAAVAAAVTAWGVAAPVRLTSGTVSTLRRRTLVVDVIDDPPGALAGLGGAIQQALVDADLPVEVRPVVPHLTLARARDRGRERGRGTIPPEVVHGLVVPSVTWSVAAVRVVQSVLGRGPATYVPVATVPLAASPD